MPTRPTGSRVRSRAGAAGRHCPRDDGAHPLGGLDKVRIGKVGVARRGLVPSVSKQLADQGQILARHDGLTGGGVTQIV